MVWLYRASKVEVVKSINFSEKNPIFNVNFGASVQPNRYRYRRSENCFGKLAEFSTKVFLLLTKIGRLLRGAPKTFVKSISFSAQNRPKNSPNLTLNRRRRRTSGPILKTKHVLESWRNSLQKWSLS